MRSLYVFVAAVGLVVIAASARALGLTPPPRTISIRVYVAGVLVVLGFVLGAAYLIGGTPRLRLVAPYAAGFVLGMLSTYIAAHMYRLD